MPWAGEGQHPLPKTSTVILARHWRYRQGLVPSRPLLCAWSGASPSWPRKERAPPHRAVHGVSTQHPWGTHGMGSPASPAPTSCFDLSKLHTLGGQCFAPLLLSDLECCPAHWQQIWENVKFLHFWETQWDSLSTQLNRRMPLISEARLPDPWSF